MKKKTAKEKKKARVDAKPRPSPSSDIYDDVLRVLFLVLPVLLGFIVGSIIWPSVQLPFNNSFEIVSPLARLKFNPASNILRFIVFISLPALLFFLMLRIPFIKNLFSLHQGRNVDIPDQTIAGFRAAPDTHRIIKIASVSLLVAWIIVSSGNFFLQPFQAEVLDFWHEGEFLTPAFNFIKTG